MATPESLTDAVKTAIAGGGASASTLTTLKTLLSAVGNPKAKGERESSRPITARRSSAASRTAKSIQRPNSLQKAAKNPQIVSIYEDEVRALSPKARYALATDIVNISLKALSDAPKSNCRPHRRHSSAESTTTPVSLSKSQAEPQRGLQLRSVNATPVAQSPAKQQKPSRRPSQRSVDSGIRTHVTSAAECARLAFSYLRSVDVAKLGLRDLPWLQLETGMVALSGKLINLGLHSLACRELQVIKGRLEALMPFNLRSAKPEKLHMIDMPEREVLSSLLRLELDFDAWPEAWPLIITYYLNGLHVIGSIKSRSTTEDSAQYLRLDRQWSPAHLIVRQAKRSGDTTKATRQLEALSRSVLQLCPSVSTAADIDAQKSAQFPTPVTTFKLQTLSLSIRQEIWILASHKVDFGKDIAEPLSKCLSTLIRRLLPINHNVDVFDDCQQACEKVCNHPASRNLEDGHSMSVIYRLLSILAEKASLYEQSYLLARQSLDNCCGLDSNHARAVTPLARHIYISFLTPSCLGALNDLIPQIQNLSRILQQKVCGSSLDCKVLLGELWNLLCNLRRPAGDEPLLREMNLLAGAAAGYACVFCTSFAGHEVDTAQEIIRSALSYCGSDDRLLYWVSKDAVQILIQSGTLSNISEKMSRQPMLQAWASYNPGVALGRLLKILVLKAANTHAEKCVDLIVDDHGLDLPQRGALLEWQVKCALDVVHKTKYRSAMRKLLPDMFRRLSIIYPASGNPLRRGRVAVRAIRAREEFPDCVPDEILQSFLAGFEIDKSDLREDHTLAAYASDIKASLLVSQAFYDGIPTTEILWPCIQSWRDILYETTNATTLAERIDSPPTLHSQLASIEQYLSILGHEDVTRITVAELLVRSNKLCDIEMAQCEGLTILARAYLSVGHAEKATFVLAQAETITNNEFSCNVDVLDYRFCRAEYFLALDKLEDCRHVFTAALQGCRDLDPKRLRTNQWRRYQLLHARAWLLDSEILMAGASPHGALQSAKRAVKTMNSIWAAICRPIEQPESHCSTSLTCEEPEIQGLTDKVSKLNLTKTKDRPSTSDSTTVKGAAFWPVVRLLCRSLMHLADVYLHHGSFTESNYASEQAIKAAELVGLSGLLSPVRSHRGRLLGFAGRVEDAELCLAQDQTDICGKPSIAGIERLRTKAALAVKHSDFQDATNFLCRASDLAKMLQSDSHIPSVDSQSTAEEQPYSKLDVKRLPQESSTSGARLLKRGSRLHAKSRTITGKANKDQSTTPQSTAIQAPGSRACHLLQKLEANLTMERVLVSGRLESPQRLLPKSIDELYLLLSNNVTCRHVEHQFIMKKVACALEADFTFNSLPESTLAFPIVVQQNEKVSNMISTATHAPIAKRLGKASKGSKGAGCSQETLETLLVSARQNLTLDYAASQMLTTAETHAHFSLSSNLTMIMSATQASNTLSPVREALMIDVARIHAASCARVIAATDREAHQSLDLLAWPQTQKRATSEPLSEENFRRQFIDILPRTWTAVSLCLNEAADELYVARYQRSQPPLVLRLPFSRQRTADGEEDIFDFHMGKAELKDIIELSNYSCHNSLDHEAKGAKTNWWKEREALDRRLQELLINIENIWFGGFKGVLSQAQIDQHQLDHFRKSLDAILDRHLPSRRAARRDPKGLALNDQILTLFTGLGPDHDGEGELDESLADLLFFVVDILQFNGERNAYDEIDFDSMAIEVLDALRVYHESVEEEEEVDTHLILVLDRRLQNIPLESMPCLESSSVSRVDSMLTLRERILEMSPKAVGLETDRHVVARGSGSYILNPSSDLKNTEATLSPALSSLRESAGACWRSIVGRKPSEEDFKAAITTSSTILYFGHGAGSQYIRPRTIRRLDKCSEVVWLMGCSSGAVTEHDELEPCSVPLAYLNAGCQDQCETPNTSPSKTKCMAVVATLWDVTDKDIDRFSLAMGEEWGLWQAPKTSTTLPVKTPRKREKVAAPHTPERPAKTPKTPKVRKTPAPARTPARSRSCTRPEARGKKSLVEAVARSREACYLRYLNGAAPVVYGVPVYLGN